MQGIKPMDPCEPWDDTYLHNYKLEELVMIALDPIDVLMEIGKITNNSPLPGPSTNLRGKQIRISSLDTAR